MIAIVIIPAESKKVKESFSVILGRACELYQLHGAEKLQR